MTSAMSGSFRVTKPFYVEGRSAADPLGEPRVHRVGVVDEEEKIVEHADPAQRVLDGRGEVVAERRESARAIGAVALIDAALRVSGPPLW